MPGRGWADDSTVVIREGQRELARHPLAGPGEVSLLDEHYPGAGGAIVPSTRTAATQSEAPIPLAAPA